MRRRRLGNRHQVVRREIIFAISLDEFIRKARDESILEAIPVHEAAALQVARLPLLHSDPFDRILIAQAIEHGMMLATPDPLIRQYAVRTVWD